MLSTQFIVRVHAWHSIVQQTAGAACLPTAPERDQCNKQNNMRQTQNQIDMLGRFTVDIVLVRYTAVR